MTLPESAESRLRRLKIRAWRRGTKEMDLVLGNWADERLGSMDAAALDAFEALLEENDQDLMRWILGYEAVPEAHAALLEELSVAAQARFRAAT